MNLMGLTLGKFKPVYSYGQYKLYCGTGHTRFLRKSFSGIVPLVPMKLKQLYKIDSSWNDFEELVSHISFELWCVLENQKVVCNSVALFIGYLVGVIKNSVPDAINDSVKGIGIPEGYVMPCQVCEGANVAEARIAIEEIPVLVMAKISSSMRFTDEEELVVCFIISEMSHGRVPTQDTIRNNFGLNNARFFIDYAKVMWRWELYKYRELYGSEIFKRGNTLIYGQTNHDN